MGAKINIYELYFDPTVEDYLLIELKRDNFSNWDESDYDRAQIRVKDRISRFIEGRDLKPIGRMEYSPVGEEIYDANSGDKLHIYYCYNNLDRRFIILGTGKDENTFLSEALEEYGAEVDKSNVSKVLAKFERIQYN